MRSVKVIIIGGVAGGASAAARLRRLDEKAEIIMLERSGYISYANCGLPYYIGGVIREKGALSVQTPESFGGRFRIDVRVRNEAVSIDPKEKTVRVRNLETGEEYTETYDKLLLSPGAKAIRPALPGMEDARIMTLRTVEDTLAIREYLEEKKPKRAVVVGGGFIGLEAAENLMEEGLEVSLIQMEDQVLPPLDYDMACQVHAYLRGKGLNLRLNRTVTGFVPDEGGLRVQMKRTAGTAEASGKEESIREGGKHPGRFRSDGGGRPSGNGACQRSRSYTGAERRHRRQRTHADLGCGHLCGGRRGGDPTFHHREENACGAGGTGQPAGAHCGGQHLRIGQRL